MNGLLLGDCVECMNGFPDGCIDLTVTSPPYDNIRDYNGYTFDYRATLEQLYRVTKDGGVVVWIVNDQTVNGSESGTSFKQALYAKQCGFNLHDTMIWDKVGCSFPDVNRYLGCFEYMFILSKGKPAAFHPITDRRNIYAGIKAHATWRQPDGTTKKKSNGQVYQEYGRRYNIWQIPSEKHNTTGHPAVFPVRLVQDHIITWSNEGDTVLDPFMGSGTTGVAAHNAHRDFVGIEVSEEYFNGAKRRIEESVSQMSIFDTNGGG